MKRVVFGFVLLALSAVGLAVEEWVGIYMQGSKIGYSSFEEKDGGWRGSPGKHSASLSVIDSKLLGASLMIETVGTTWYDASGQPQRLEYTIESGGRVSEVTVEFKGGKAHVTSNLAGKTKVLVLDVPKGKKMISDPTTDLVMGGTALKEIEFVSFDPNLLALIEGKASYVGREKTEIGDITVDAHVVVVDDPRASMRVFVSEKGDLIKATGPLGLELYPESKEDAMDMSSAAGSVSDIAFVTSIRPDRPIPNAERSVQLGITVAGTDASHLPSDEHQTVSRSATGWEVKIHPVKPDPSSSTTIEKAGRLMPQWIRPDSRIESDLEQFKKLGKEIIGGSKGVLDAAEKIRSYVHSIVRANAGIGIIRDATEILATREGVCRDHAVLSATLMRAVGIPTRLASGLVYAQGAFFYHAWVEVYNGEHWVGYDSTRKEKRLSATHIKTGQGTIEQAYSSFLLDGARITVSEIRS